ncbi:hypothetical protein IV04_15210 [Serratia sp. Ag1]|nr:hypothetical protein JV45_13940 [Serratia sp. Ag2]KFK97711.1 hypothetical protein IV04_15210 [Serratia sp. Ag1]
MSMNLTYTVRDAEEWAAFSGDYNPIHFDLQYVRNMGAEQLSVHGMRAMLDMKRHLSAALLATSPQEAFYTCSTRLRHPVLCHTPYQLQITENGKQITGKLLDSTTQECCFSSKLTASQPLALASQGQEHRLPLAEVMTLSQQFPGEASDTAQTWGFFDALLFQLLVKSPETLAMVTETLPELTAATLIDVFAQIPVVQTHHETQFSAKLLLPDAHYHLVEGLDYAIQPMLIMGSRDSGFVLRTEIQGRVQQQPLITTAVTLKTWPLASH